MQFRLRLRLLLLLLLLLLLFLTLQLYLGFGRLYQIIQALMSVMRWAQFLSFGVPLISFGVCFGRLQYLSGFTALELVTLIFTRLGR